MTDPTDKNEGDPSTPTTVVVGVVGTITVFVIIVLLTALYHTVNQRWVDKRIVNQAPEALTQLRSRHIEELHSYSWVNEKEGTVTIPIERAMELVVKDRQAGSGGGGTP